MPLLFTSYRCGICYRTVQTADAAAVAPPECREILSGTRICQRCVRAFRPCFLPDCEDIHINPQIAHGSHIVWQCQICAGFFDCRTQAPLQGAFETCLDCTAQYVSRCEDCNSVSCSRLGSNCRCGRVESHGFKPPYVFRYLDKDGEMVKAKAGEIPKRSVFLGYELEVEATTGKKDVSELVKTVKKFKELPFFLKHDGSLHNGMEIVSHPTSLDAWRKLWPQVEDLYGQLRGLGARSYHTTTCGLHIHVNRSAFISQLHLLKLCRLLYSNQKEVFKLSQRESVSQLSQWAKFDVSADGLVEKIKRYRSSDRYSAVNVTNLKTIEFRFFKGTLEPSSVWRALESVNAFVEYSRQTSAKLVESFDLFAKFVNGKKGSYDRLAEFLKGTPSADTTNTES